MDEAYIATRLASLRIKKDVSARDMSLSIGQASNYIHNIESGKTLPSISGLLYICEYLKISPSEFFDEGNSNPALLNKVIERIKSLNDDALEAILVLASQIPSEK